jgi:hypothetical protein
MKKIFISWILFFVSSSPLIAQEKITTVGLQIKPIFPVSFVNTGSQIILQNQVSFDLTLNSGFSGGMIIRHGFSDLLAFETGINYVKRKYDLQIKYGSSNDDSQFRIIGYEIPLSLLVYIQLGEKTFMNVSMGHSLDMFVSNVQSYDDYFIQYSTRKSLFQSALLANVGWEYRTEKSGYFYLGASYHRPFSYIYASRIRYKANGKDEEIITTLLGNYLTIDLRYFFNEDVKKKPKPVNDDQ